MDIFLLCNQICVLCIIVYYSVITSKLTKINIAITKNTHYKWNNTVHTLRELFNLNLSTRKSFGKCERNSAFIQNRHWLPSTKNEVSIEINHRTLRLFNSRINRLHTQSHRFCQHRSGILLFFRRSTEITHVYKRRYPFIWY